MARTSLLPLRALRRQFPLPCVELLGFQPAEVVQQQVAGARAFLFAAHEDFGISPVEAQACGTPVIADEVGGSRETVRDSRTEMHPTGLLFDQQTPASLRAAVEAFDAPRIAPQDCRRWAERFDEAVFAQGFSRLLEQAWSAWCRDPSSVEEAAGAGRGLEGSPPEIQV